MFSIAFHGTTTGTEVEREGRGKSRKNCVPFSYFLTQFSASSHLRWSRDKCDSVLSEVSKFRKLGAAQFHILMLDFFHAFNNNKKVNRSTKEGRSENCGNSARNCKASIHSTITHASSQKRSITYRHKKSPFLRANKWIQHSNRENVALNCQR